MIVPCRSEFQSINRAAISRRMTTQNPIAHTSGSALIPFQLQTADSGMISGVTHAGREPGSSAAGRETVVDGRSTSTGSAFCGNSTAPSAGLAIEGGLVATTAV